jgi:exopolysaccharide biosynthesis WecB/TagA/CpsF family protein
VRILYLTTYEPARSELGGASWVDRRLVQDLSEDHDVDVVPVLHPASVLPPVPMSVMGSRFAQARVLARMAIRTEAYLEAKFRFHPSWLAATRHVKSIVTQQCHDLVLTSQWPALLMSEDAGFSPHLHIAHNVDTVLAQRYDPAALRALGDVRRLEAAERRLLRRAGRVMTLSGSDAERLQDWGIDAGLVSLARVHPQSPNSPTDAKHRIGFIGSMGWPPNRSAFEELVGGVLPKIGELDAALRARLTVVVAGRGSEEMSGPGVEVFGVVRDVADFYAATDLVVVPRTGARTGISVKMLEALENDVNVIAPRGLLEDVGLRAGAWGADSTDEMAERIIAYYRGGLQSRPSVQLGQGLADIRSVVAQLRPVEPPAILEDAPHRTSDGHRFVRDMAELNALVRHGRRPLRIQTLNLQHLQLSSVNEQFRAAVVGADRLTADGWPVQLFMWRKGVRVDRVTGSGFLRQALDSSLFAGLEVALLGGTPAIGDRFDALVRTAGGRLVFRDHGRVSEWDADDLVHRIAVSGAQVVLVAVTAPGSELIAHQLRTRSLDACIIGIGGAVDMVTGVRVQAPNWITRSGLEWLFRFAQEPRRLFRRYFLQGVPFMLRFVTGRVSVPGLD